MSCQSFFYEDFHEDRRGDRGGTDGRGEY